jgi:hypothetical protein
MFSVATRRLLRKVTQHILRIVGNVKNSIVYKVQNLLLRVVCGIRSRVGGNKRVVTYLGNDRDFSYEQAAGEGQEAATPIVIKKG